MTAPSGRDLVSNVIGLDPDQRAAFAEALQPIAEALRRVPRLAAVSDVIDRLLAVADDPLSSDVFTEARLADEVRDASR